MKIIHCADLHLDSKMEQLSIEKSKQRREEILQTFEKLCVYATENSVSAVIISGDIFDTERVSNKTKERFLRAISTASNVQFFCLAGNHDINNSLFEDANNLDNLFVFSNKWSSFRAGDVVISGIIIDKQNSASFYDSLNLNEEDVNIVALHGQIAGYKSKENAEVISLPRLKDKNIDYLALGHIHEQVIEKLDNRTTYAYSGCLEGRGFDETGDKGFILLNISNGKITPSFVPFAKRKLYEITFDVANYNSFYDFVQDLNLKLKSEYSPSSLFKIILNGLHGAEFVVDKNKLVETLNENFFFAKVYDKTELNIKPQDYENDKSIRGEFVRAVLESNLDNQVKSRVIMCGINALKGEEI